MPDDEALRFDHEYEQWGFKTVAVTFHPPLM